MNINDERYADLVAVATSCILSTFCVQKTEAEALGKGFVETIESHGGDPTSFSSRSIQRLILSKLGNTYTWKNSQQKLDFEQARRDEYEDLKKMLAPRTKYP